jgi:7-cyano-7-deazaguanine synthase in queuosine biosynthesis
MQPERYIICGDAIPQLPSEAESKALRIHLYGADDECKVTLRIEDIRRQMFKEVPDRFRDLLDIATYVYAADQAVKRGHKDVETFDNDWRRHFHFVIPVREPGFWNSEEVTRCLRDTLGFLSDDEYDFDFAKLSHKSSFQMFLDFDDQEMFGTPEQVVMFSGGLDSLGGAVEEIVNQKRRLILVNHRATQKLDNRYRDIRDRLNGKASINTPYHVRVTVNKKKWMNQEPTQRSRSFLFVSLGATIANMLGMSSLRFYENGVISMNLPICAQVVGGKATRTTHPLVMQGFRQLLRLVADQRFDVENPFLWKTKCQVVELIARADCEDLIGPSISCTHTWEITNEHSHCGTCSQCIDRRFAIIAAGLEVSDPIAQYKVDVFVEGRDKDIQVQEDKTMFANYLERANQVAKLTTPIQFLARYPEIARVLRYLEGDPSSNAQKCYDLYTRHSKEVNTVIDKMLSVHRTAIRLRTLPADAMLRIVYESSLPSSAPAIPVAQEPMPDNVFRRAGGAWQVRFNGKKALTVLPWTGASYIHALLECPGEPRAAIEVVCSTAVDYCGQAIRDHDAIEAGIHSSSDPLFASLGKISDWEAVRAYRTEAVELLAAIEEARVDNNNVLVQQYENDMAKVVAKINEAVGLGGRLKDAVDKRKNIRDSFRNNVKRVIEKQIAGTDPELAAHLESSIKFGNTPQYDDQGIRWETQPVRNG